MNELSEFVAKFGSRRLLVVGDLMLDRYVVGDAARVSPEAPVLVLNTDEQDERPGGAASVAAIVRGLGAQVALAGVLGHDAHGERLRKIHVQRDIDDRLVVCDDTRPTTTKQRF
ncbi:MAG: PfkB family carbohydrate kinase, partial [Pirellulaceae bacterium]